MQTQKACSSSVACEDLKIVKHHQQMSYFSAIGCRWTPYFWYEQDSSQTTEVMAGFIYFKRYFISMTISLLVSVLVACKI
jgi:hypothetical protein